MAAQQTNLCVYRKGHRLRRNTGPYCTALSLYVMSSVKWAAGQGWGVLSVCVVLNFTKSKDFYCRMKHLQTRHTELRGSTLYPSRTLFVCVRCKTSAGSGFRCDLPVPVSSIVVVFGTGLGFEELTENIAWLPFARGRGRHSLWWHCDVGVVCGGENHLPTVSSLTLQAALLSSNKQHWKFSIKIKSVVRVR